MFRSAMIRYRKIKCKAQIFVGEIQHLRNFRGDGQNIAILFFLYLLQGIPLGLSAAIPMYLQNRGVSYRGQAKFSFTNWPFSLKLLWAPIVDSVYFTRFGRRKSWLIPSQYLIGAFMVYLSTRVDIMLGEPENSSDPDITSLTTCFFMLNFFAATQDIVVDGWALTMLKRKNVGYASTCNSVGQTAGYFLGYVVFMALDSPEFCNRYLRLQPEMEGVVTLSGFLLFWGVIFLVTTTLIAIKKHETNPPPSERRLGVAEAYTLLWKILKLPSVQTTILVLLTSKIGYSACDAVATLKMVEGGIPKETLAGLSIPLVPMQIVLPLIISKFLVRSEPMSFYLKAVPYRLCFTLCVVILVWATPKYVHDGVISAPYLFLVLVVYILIQVSVNVMFVSVMAFFAQISDPAVGGTYMTLMNTVNNLAGTWPSTVALWMVDALTISTCSKGHLCQGSDCPEETATCTVVDGYYIESILCFTIGILWLRWASWKIVALQKMKDWEWKVLPEQKR